MTDVWVIATDTAGLSTAVRLGAAAGPVTVVAVGDRALAEACARSGAGRVAWVEPASDVAPDAVAPALADAVLAAAPRLVLAGPAAASRSLLGAVGIKLGAGLVAGVHEVRADGDTLELVRTALDGAVVETLRTTAPVAAVVRPGDEPVAAEPCPVEPLTLPFGDVRTVERHALAVAGGVTDAERVVSVGRGVRARDDLALVESLTSALGAELGCSMPVADDLGWVPKERYVGRSGQHISPRLYLALGISGMPQHMEGVRGARVVAAVNSDPQAPIFRTADYGVVGDLYEVVPALVEALTS